MMSSALFSPRSLSKTEEIKEKLLYCHCIFVERMGFQALFSHSKGKMWKKDKKIYLFFNLIMISLINVGIDKKTHKNDIWAGTIET